MICLFINIGILSVTKYTNFVIQNINDMLHGVSGLHTVNMIVPMGISFYTFQTMGYIIDVYRGNRVLKRISLSWHCLFHFSTIGSGTDKQIS